MPTSAPTPSVFEFPHYRKYLEHALAPRGRKKALAEFIPCQTTFLSNVLADAANLSLEHAIRVCEFLQLNVKESHYFMLLVHYGKAGSPALEKYYRQQIDVLQAERKDISRNISAHGTIPLEDQLNFYNSWIHVAVHILCAIEKFRSREALRAYLHFTARELDPVIDLLVQLGLIQESGGRLKQGQARMHLPKDSPFLSKHHINWRMRAVQSLDHRREEDLHYTMVMSLSEKDVVRMRDIVMEAIQRTDRLLSETGDEVVYSLCMDWFKI